MNNLTLNFSIKEFCITDDPISLDVADKILHHIKILQPIRDKLKSPINISKNSGYRPYKYELDHKRSGESEHVFFGGGAVDLTTSKSNLGKLLELLMKSEYKRVCYYPNKNFIHCDLKGSGKRFFMCYDGKNWELQ